MIVQSRVQLNGFVHINNLTPVNTKEAAGKQTYHTKEKAELRTTHSSERATQGRYKDVGGRGSK